MDAHRLDALPPLKDDEFAAFRSIERGSFKERCDTARRLKEEGNSLLHAGDFEEALHKYVEGLYQMDFHERALAMVQLPQADTDAMTDIKVPLLLNAALCEMRMAKCLPVASWASRGFQGAHLRCPVLWKPREGQEASGGNAR